MKLDRILYPLACGHTALTTVTTTEAGKKIVLDKDIPHICPTCLDTATYMQATATALNWIC